jgi:nanoRNase/pAp phosphatase (c-di-AMP/oligoRNAs hydrolase)
MKRVAKKIPAKKRLGSFYQQFANDDDVLILINADPDAIASALAVKRLLWHRVARVTIANANVIKRPDNLAMIRLTGANLTHIDQIDGADFTRIVMVDSQPDHLEAFADFDVSVIIDHHPVTDAQAAFSDIRPTYGATASILTEYLRAAKIKPSAKLATALLHAIKTDTANFVRQTRMEDIRAFQFLFRLANMHLAWKMEHADMQIGFLAYFKSALAHMQLRKNRIFVYLGDVETPDVCVLIADFFMHVNKVGWSIVAGSYGDKLVVIFRNDGVRKNAGTVAKQSFGHLGSAGGHKSMARAEIDLDALDISNQVRKREKIQRWIIKSIEKRAGKK